MALRVRTVVEGGMRVSASTAILERGLGTVGKARMPDEMRDRPLGKKEEAARAAEASATGRYATPPPPKALAERTSLASPGYKSRDQS